MIENLGAEVSPDQVFRRFTFRYHSKAQAMFKRWFVGEVKAVSRT
jgi:hypothetical protein